jgi:ribosomal protein S12 methylthiotransferase accessory factor YcaO
MFHTPTPNSLTVRTLAKEKHSRDSSSARIPQDILQQQQQSNKPKDPPTQVITVTNQDGTEDTVCGGIFLLLADEKYFSVSF